MITKDQKKELRKLLGKDYPTAADVERIADDIDLSIEGVDMNANIITIWGEVLDKASSDEKKWKELVAILKDEMDTSALDAILSNNSPTDDDTSDAGESTRAIGGMKEKPSAANPEKKTIYKNHLLVIGANDYSNNIPVLENAYPDAKEFYKVLTEKYQFEESSSIFLENKNATRKNIIDSFQKLTETLTPNDNLIFYFAGHGELDKVTNIGYWIPVDAVKGDTSTYISNDTIKSYLSGMKVQHSVGIIDACFSGSMVLRSNLDVVERYYNIPSRWVMTSGVEEVVPDGQPGRNSPFAKSLLAHLQNNTEDVLGLTKLWLKFREGVVANSVQTPLCQPVQSTGHLGGEFFFLLKNAKLEGIPKSSPSIDLTINRSMEKTDLTDLKIQMEELVGKDNMPEVFEFLNEKLSKDSSHRNTFIMQQASYNGAVRGNAKGIMRDENYRMTLARVRNGVLYIVQKLEEKDIV